MSDPRLPGGTRIVRLPGCVFPLALLLFLGVPLAEVAVLITSARVIGFWWTVLACIATGVIGSAIARWQGAVVFRRAQESLMRGELPAKEVVDGIMILVGGVLLLVPGFVTDLMGLVFLLPPTRALLNAAIRAWWKRQGGVIDVKAERVDRGA